MTDNTNILTLDEWRESTTIRPSDNSDLKMIGTEEDVPKGSVKPMVGFHYD